MRINTGISIEKAENIISIFDTNTAKIYVGGRIERDIIERIEEGYEIDEIYNSLKDNYPCTDNAKSHIEEFIQDLIKKEIIA